MVYLNTSIFAISLVPIFTKYLWRNGFSGARRDAVHLIKTWNQKEPQVRPYERDGAEERLLPDGDGTASELAHASAENGKLSFQETAKFSLEFCLIWFISNYFTSACFEYTSVASGTILASTSGVWTLVCSALFRIEPFTARKFIGVMASLAGIILTSTIDLTGNDDRDSGSFPHKTTGEMAVGDAMAFMSAVMYGLYVTIMKKRVGNEDRLDMALFFGLIGLFNLLLLWPLFFVLHWTGLESFQLPPSDTVWTVLLVSCQSEIWRRHFG